MVADSTIELLQSNTKIGLQATGVLRLVVGETAGKRALRLQFDDPRVTLRIDDQEAAPQSLAAELMLSVACELDTDGAVRAVFVPEAFSTEARTIYQTLCYALQTVESGTSQTASWDFEEQDAMGKYIARYESRAAGLSKRKVRYLEVAQAPAASGALRSKVVPIQPSVRIVESAADYELDEHGQLKTLAHRESVEIGVGTAMSVRASSRLELQRRADVHVAAPVALPSSSLRRLPAGVALPPMDPEARARVQGKSLDEVLATLKTSSRASAAEPGSVGSPAEVAARSDLARLLRAEAKNVDVVKRHLATDTPLARQIVMALGASGSSEAQHALCELLRRPKADSTLRYLAAVQVSLVGQPTSEVVETLQALLSDSKLRAQAAFGLGSVAHSLLGIGDEARARAVTDLLIARLRDAPRESEAVLRGLGNAGHPGALDAITSRLADPDPAIRGAAVRALRFLPGVDELVARRLAEEADPKVRLEALAAVRSRAATPELVAAVSHCAANDTSPHVRYAAVRELLKWKPSEPAVGSLLARVATTDSEAKIRSLARGEPAGSDITEE